MFKYTAGGLGAVLSIAVIANLVANIPVAIDINNNYESKIRFGASAASVEQALPEFISVDQWLKSKNLTTGNTCVWIWEQSQRCELTNLANKVDDTVKTLKSSQQGTVADKALVLQQVRYGWFLHEGNEGEKVYMPKDFTNYLKYGEQWKSLGMMLDALALLLLLVIFVLLASIASS